MVPSARAGLWRAADALLASPLWRALANAAADLFFPPSCLACRQATETANSLCPACWAQVKFIERPFCERLGLPFAMDLGAEGLLSPEAVANPPVFLRARAAAQFEDGPVRDLVHRLKYYDRLELAKPLGAWMARAGADLLLDADVLAPIPLHRGRLIFRQFNQANALAQAVSAASGVPVDPFLLERVKATAPQVRLSRSQRELNMQGAFKIRDENAVRAQGRNIVLIDDVMTSGATLNAAARALLRAKAKRADVLVFARTV